MFIVYSLLICIASLMIGIYLSAKPKPYVKIWKREYPLFHNCVYKLNINGDPDYTFIIAEKYCKLIYYPHNCDKRYRTYTLNASIKMNESNPKRNNR